MRRLGLLLTVPLLVACGLSAEEEAQRDLEFGAEDVCRTFVERRLVSPGSAEFGDLLVEPGEGDQLRVSGTVDSQNRMGGLLRSDFTCVVRPADAAGERWDLIRMEGLEN